MNRLIQRNRDRNRQSGGAWQSFAFHRRRVTDLLCALDGGPDQSLCVLGAGNCNDLELDRLVRRYGHVHLVDLDGEALEAGLRRQSLAAHLNITIHPCVDFTGLYETMSTWDVNDPPPDNVVDAAVARVRSHRLDLGKFDAVASICTLSQMIEALTLSLGEGHARFIEVMREVRAAHIGTMIEIAKVGGECWLVTDFVSSDTVEALRTMSGDVPIQQVQPLLKSGNFFHGLNPVLIQRLLTTEPGLAGNIRDVRFVPPWVWDLGPRRYLVCAHGFKRK